jgi:hypothetical protein
MTRLRCRPRAVRAADPVGQATADLLPANRADRMAAPEDPLPEDRVAMRADLADLPLARLLPEGLAATARRQSR